jgi:hypothetical protein
VLCRIQETGNFRHDTLLHGLACASFSSNAEQSKDAASMGRSKTVNISAKHESKMDLRDRARHIFERETSLSTPAECARPYHKVSGYT